MAADTTIPLAGHRQFKAASDGIAAGRRTAGRWLIALATVAFIAFAVLQAFHAAGATAIGFATWRPVLYAYVLWSVALGVGLVLIRGEAGYRALFVLPAVLFILAMAIFPTLFGFYIAFTDWNLSAFEGRKFNGIDNLVTLIHDPYFWNALGNMVFYVLAIAFEYAIAFGLALLLNHGDPGAQVLPRRLPDPLHAEPGRGQLDDRQVDARIPLRPGGALCPHARLGQSGLLRLAMDRAGYRSRCWTPGCRSPSS